MKKCLIGLVTFGLMVFLVGSCFAATLGETNALASAKQYLSIMPFSYEGLKNQLEFDGFSSQEAQYGVDNCGANWFEQAEKSGSNYLQVLPLSRKALKEQLVFDGFTEEEAEYGVSRLFEPEAQQAETTQGYGGDNQLQISEPEGFLPVYEIGQKYATREELEVFLYAKGYAGSEHPFISDSFTYENQEANPYQLIVGYDSVKKQITGAIIYYQNDTEMLEYLIESLTIQFGNPTGTPAEQATGESLRWKSEKGSFTLTVVGTLENARKGEEEYYLLVDLR